VFEEFRETLLTSGYHVSAEIAFSPDYGVPQRRHRLVLLASRLGKISFLPPTHSPVQYKTVKDAIGSLPPLNAGEMDERDPLHKASRLSPLNLRRIRESRPGGTWRDWSPELVAACHRAETGRSYASVYGRMTWEEPSPTVTTQFYGFGNGRFGHPEQDRALSIREGAILQTFPKDYEFVEPRGNISFKKLGKLIGNAVPVDLGRVIARSIRDHLDQHPI
ncbi:MAG: DNA cytosine methyltransferase, partial [Bacteroidota bacterium]